MAAKQKICTFLWYDGAAEEAAAFYVSLFPGSRIRSVSRYGKGAPRPEGTAMVVDFELAGQRFQALNGGPEFRFTEAVSLMIDCESQEEVDRLWERLTSDGGRESMCGWCKDRWGLSWQVVPSAALSLLQDPDPSRSARVWAALMQMRKIDLAALQRAHAGA